MDQTHCDAGGITDREHGVGHRSSGDRLVRQRDAGQDRRVARGLWARTIRRSHGSMGQDSARVKWKRRSWSS